MILAGDIGGTASRLSLFPAAPSRVPVGAAAESIFASRDFPSLEAIVRRFVEQHGAAPSRAAFGVPGPVIDGVCRTTNLPWVVEEAALARTLGVPVTLMNDLEAAAIGIAALAPADRVVLLPGAPEARGNAAVIAPGTGLGEAGLFWDGTRHVPFATEGGHASFAPADALQAELFLHLRDRLGHVSWERLVSGPGLVRLYEFLRDTGRGEEPEWLRRELAAGDPPAVISGAALAGRSDLCARALDLFVTLLGAEAGNLALKVMATGGVDLAGGIVPRIVTRLRGPLFAEAFLSKGRMRPLLERILVRAVLNDKVALLGAAARAREGTA